MIKKIQNLLFEDDIPEEENDQEVLQVEVKKETETMVKESKPLVKNEPEKVKDVVEKPVEPVKPSFPNITLDDENKPKKNTVKMEKKKVHKVADTKNREYQFQPVISPIFGAAEKDINALKSTTSKLNEQEKKKNMENINTILSPMWGKEENSPFQVPKEKEDILADHNSVDDEIPEFSLDDILNVHDKEYHNPESEKNDPVFTADSDSFPQLNLFDDEMEEVEDNTTVIKKQNK